MKHKKRRISLVITNWLIIIVLLACVISAILTYIALSKRSENQTALLVRQNVEDVSIDISEMADQSILAYVYRFVNEGYITSANIDDIDALNKELEEYYPEMGVEVNVINKDGIIIASSVPKYIGYDMHAGDQASEFLVLLDGSTEEYVQDMTEVSYDGKTQMKYAGIRFDDGSGFLEIGLTSEVYYDQIMIQAYFAATNRRIGENGYMLICDEDGKIINSYHNDYTEKTLEDAGIILDPDTDYDYVALKTDVFGVPSYVNINKVKGIYVIGIYSVSEAITNVNTMMNASIILEIFVFSILLVTLIVLLRKVIVNNIVKVNDSLTQITEGNLNEKVEVRDTLEFDSLSSDINATVDRLKGYIAEAEARMDADLAVAKDIQSSALPSVFPPFPSRHEFELYANMKAAKEVGGDFYDFYMLGTNTLAFLIADVSGKSIPGAMFMMKSKEVIKSSAESGLDPAGIFTKANKTLCEENDAEMFLTAWMGFLNTETGEVNVANAGHNPPVLIRDGKADYLKLKPGLMLAGMDDMEYKQQTFSLEKGDILFLYTDGVTEAMDVDENLYGEDRLIKLLSFGYQYPEPAGEHGVAGAICDIVSADIEDFVQDAEQSDDITMLCLRYLGDSAKAEDDLRDLSEVKEITLDATPENVDKAIEFVDEILEENDCGVKEQTAIDVAMDELFSNIAHYAYKDRTGYATVQVEVINDPRAVEITFIDEGMPYDPLAKLDPDTSEPLENRQIGGMGILIVKKSMDAMTYEYKDGKNILKIKKLF